MSKRKYCLNIFILLAFIGVCYYINTNEKITTNDIVTDSFAYSSKTHQIPIAKLIIKKIGIENNLYDIGTNENQVDRNVTILKESTFPDKEESILFIAAHSGDGKIAYFKNLDQLKIKDIAEFIYQGNRYIYEIVNMYEREKNGYIELNKISKHQLVLTTCSPKRKGMQLIINAELIKKEKID